MVGTALAAIILFQQQTSAPPPTPAAVAVDTGSLRHSHGRTPPVAAALRLTGAPPGIDGRLDDPAWAAAEAITRFTQNVPHEGQPATERTEVRIAYDDQAIYVGARMFDSDPAGIRTQLGRRDAFTQADGFTVAFDSYHDHRTSFRFSVNPSGVRSDQVTSNDNGFGDDSWDPVWEVATTRDSLGWTAEMRIPFSQLRFPPSATQVWGVNLSRFIHRKAEHAEFAWSAQTDRGFASFFGHLFGLADLPQPRRLELLPYATAREERVDPGAAGNPFNDGSVEVASAGLDFKYGLTSNLTLDATLNPDFGQVEADPAVVNLSAFESFFEERRPFFIEGAEIFRFAEGGPLGGTQFFYSRRIGRPPQGFADSRGGFVDQPVSSTILAAAKLSGRTGGGWSVGLLEAVTDREFATVQDSAGARFKDEVEPPTNYVVARLRRDLRGGSTTIGFIGTAVNRRIDQRSLAFLRSAAYAGGVDFTHRMRRNTFALTGSFGFSDIRGDRLAIQRAQRSSARYYQRPDADYVEYDSTRTSLTGWTGRLAFEKESGAYTYRISAGATSPGFELNDAGFQGSADDRFARLSAGRRWTRPGRVFRFANLNANAGLNGNFGGVRTGRSAGAFAFGQFLNYWGANLGFNLSARALSDALTRGGPLMVSPGQHSINAGISSDFRKPVQLFVGSFYSRNEFGGWGGRFFTGFNLRPTSAISVNLGPNYFQSRALAQFVTSADDASAATFGRRYIFAEIAQRSLDLSVRLNLTFSPTLSLQLYAQPFIATGDYLRFKELRRARSFDFLTYGETVGSTLIPTHHADSTVAFYTADPDGAGPRPATLLPNPDFALRSMRGNLVLRWEYRPGSTLFLVWTTSCSAFDRTPRFDAADDLRHLCEGSSDNVFAVKVNYWLSL